MMKRKEKFATFIFVTMLFVVHHYFFYPPVVEEGRTEDSLYAIGNAVSTGNTIRIQEEVMRYLSDNIKIDLEITYTGFAKNADEEHKPAISYDFTYGMFHAYLRNLLGSLTDYRFHATVDSFQIDGDWDSAQAIFIASGSAIGTARFVTKLRKTRFHFDAVCAADLDLTGSHPVARRLDCKMYLPKPQPLS